MDPMLATVLLQVKTPPRTPRPIPAAELDVLQAALRPRPPRGQFALLRDRAMFFFFLSTAARANEALGVDRDSYRPGGTYVRQKGGSQKLLILTDFAAQAVQDYLDARTDDHVALWITVDTNRSLRRLEAAGVREAWVRLAKRLGVTRFVTHQLRHTCATEMLDAGVDALVVADHLGHHQLKTISNYAQVRPGRREGAMRALDEHLADRAAANPKVSPAALQARRRRRRASPPEA
jgi:integrase